MKKTLMVYYSFEGNTAYVAEKMNELCGVDLERLYARKEPPRTGFGKFFYGGKSAIFKENPQLMPVKAHLDDYENLVIGFPVWAGTYPPAIGSFLKSHPLVGKNVAIIACSASGKAERALNDMRRQLSGCRIVGTLSLVSPLRHREETEMGLRKFLGDLKNSMDGIALR